MNKPCKTVLAMLMAFGVGSAYAQTPKDSTAKSDFLEMSLEDLMNVPIVSASKEKESSFDAPLTSCVITRQEMNNMGATSIPDALKYCPGLIVREVANGSYEVSIRGGIDAQPSYQFQNTSTTILAMIDNRPIFSNFQGGTYWQNLPVDIADVERIEVVYGPNAPMYGPNAVSGVINIITKKEYGDKPTVAHANIQSGISRTNSYSAYIGHKLSDKLEINASANVSARNRLKEEYYLAGQDRFTGKVNETTLENPELTLPLRNQSLRRTGLNFNVNYNPFSKVNLNFNCTYNNNQSLSLLQAGIPLNVSSNNSASHMLRGEVYGFTFQASYLSGTQGLLGNERAFFHNYKTTDAYVDYNYKINDKLGIRPSIAYQSANINDKKYTVDENKNGLFNNSGTITNWAGSLKLDYKVLKNLRLIAAVRGDKFSAPNKIYTSYQGAVNYKPFDKHMFRFAIGRSYNSSFLVPAYASLILVDQSSVSTDPNSGVTTNFNYRLSLLGNPNRNLLRNDLIELGYRGQLGKNVQLDVSLFQQEFRDFSVFVIQPAVTNVSFVPFPSPTATVKVDQTSTPQNLDMSVKQNGVSLSLIVASNDKKVSFKPHITLQETRLKNNQVYYFASSPSPLDLDVKTDGFGKSTPSWFGGFTLNINPIRRLNIGLSRYYFDKTISTSIGGQNTQTGIITPKSVDNIGSKFLLNLTAMYKVHDNVSLGLNYRNLLNDTKREAWATDKIGSEIMFSMVVEY
jgi:iron complex outermembrane receptor protein